MTSAPDPRFAGVARLFGTAGLARLRRARVAVIGLGGVGSWTAEALLRSGVGHLTLVDLDDVCVTNVNRQLHALPETAGKPKVDAMAARLLSIVPDAEVVTETAFFTAASAERLLAHGFDAVADAIDGLAAKALLIASVQSRGGLVVTSGGAGGRQGALPVEVADLGAVQSDPLLRYVRKRLRRDYGYPHGEGVWFGVPAVFSREAPVYPWADGTCAAEAEPGSSLRLDCATGFGTAAFVTGAFGLAMAGEIVRRLAAGDDASLCRLQAAPAGLGTSKS